ncbi:MAG: DUF6164 family protein [Pseudohongiellaceae bacterium]
MSILLFRLRNVPSDEAEEVRALLIENGIEIFETSPGNWGISMPAIWLRDESQLEHARHLLKEYEYSRRQRVRDEYQSLRSRGEHRTTWHVFRENPLRFLFYVALIAAVTWFSLNFVNLLWADSGSEITPHRDSTLPSDTVVQDSCAGEGGNFASVTAVLSAIADRHRSLAKT